MKNTTKAGIVGAAIFAVGTAVGYVAARVVDCIQINRMMKAAEKAEAEMLDDACDCECGGECCCDECACEAEVAPEAPATAETAE